MSDLAIQAHGLRKTYRLYKKPHYRLLDVFGLLPPNVGLLGHHQALDGISFEIRRGEKVAIIGRNGAGKSTLLKIIAGVVTPTEGSVSVAGELNALLSLGTGFHPEFTGRENVLSYLAHMGISGARADRLCQDIVNFAELQEYIDQPIKTYSAGMGMRLGFAASTVISPDVLIIDEVLSVGDAYFFKKSYERVKEICSAHGATLLMVTHDLYAAMTFCDRCIWIDGGQIRLDGPIKTVIHAYESSIRDQEEIRLRHRRQASLEENRTGTDKTLELLFGEIRTVAGTPPDTIVAISHLSFFDGETPLGTLTVDTISADAPLFIIDDEDEGNWGPCQDHHGRMAREFKTYGSIFHKLPFAVTDPAIAEAARAGRLRLELGCRSDSNCALEVALSTSSGEDRISAVLYPDSGAWRDLRASLTSAAHTPQVTPTQDIVRYGQRAMEILDVRFMDANGTETLQFRTGECLRIRLRYRLNRPGFDEKPTILIAFQKNGVLRTHRFYTEETRLSAADATEGTLDVIADPLLLSCGTYLLNVAAYAEGFFRSGDTKRFFTANDQLYDMHSRAYEIKVLESSDDVLKNDVVFLHPSRWNVTPDTATPPAG